MTAMTEIESYYSPGEFTVYALESTGLNPIDAKYSAIYCARYEQGTSAMPDAYLRVLASSYGNAARIQWIPPLGLVAVLPSLTVIYTVRIDWHEAESLGSIERRTVARALLRSV